ncbi:MAG: hypothetical protein JWL91_2099 [Sphingomonas bacterium]|nr:DUF3606 domain-containing protein [Sphingomonas bacterium]MDB5690223.1 hypothetical protein [Sphingomonas bacterium]
MADDKSKIGAEDRRTVAGDEAYEVSYFAKRHGITVAQVRELMAAHGNDRAALDAAAAAMKA